MVWSSKAWCVHVQRVPAMLQILGCPMNSCLFMFFLRACALKKYALSMSHGSDHTGVHVSSSLHSTNISSIQSSRRAVWNLRLNIKANQALSPSLSLGRDVLYMLFYSIPSPFYLTAALGGSENSTSSFESNPLAPWCYILARHMARRGILCKAAKPPIPRRNSCLALYH